MKRPGTWFIIVLTVVGAAVSAMIEVYKEKFCNDNGNGKEGVSETDSCETLKNVSLEQENEESK